MIKVTIDANGAVKIAVAGVAGKSCQDMTAALEKALGAKQGDTKTDEYFEQPTTARKIDVEG